MFTIVTYYTIGTPYEEDVLRLEEDCARWKLPFHKVGYGSTGSWLGNTSIKPTFLATMLRQFPTDLLYIDADLRLKKLPLVFEQFVGDVGIYYTLEQELLSGVLYLKNNPGVRFLLDRWQSEQLRYPFVWEQRTLRHMLTTSQDLDIRSLRCSSLLRVTDRSEHPKEEGEVVELTPSGDPIHQADDGTLYTMAQDEASVNFMSNKYDQLDERLLWQPKPVRSIEGLKELEHVFSNRVLCIIGKGPSLDKLSQKDIPTDAVIIALNESIHRVETLRLENEDVFCLQQDTRIKATCWPDQSTLLVSEKAARFYAHHDEERIYVFNKKKGLTTSSISVNIAIAMGQVFGASSFKLICFDACVGGSLQYAECIGYPARSGGKVDRFLKHRAMIDEQLGGSIVEWVIPDD